MSAARLATVGGGCERETGNGTQRTVDHNRPDRKELDLPPRIGMGFGPEISYPAEAAAIPAGIAGRGHAGRGGAAGGDRAPPGGLSIIPVDFAENVPCSPDGPQAASLPSSA